MKEKAAITRKNNTRNELKFIAKSYYDCYIYVHNCGFTDIETVDRQFEPMVQIAILANKIKNESFEKFKKIKLWIHVARHDIWDFPNSDLFVEEVLRYFDMTTAPADVTPISNNLYKNFKLFLKENNLNISNNIADIAFIELLYSLAYATDNKSLESVAAKYKNALGYGNVKFEGPQIITYDDGCSHRRMESLFKNMELLNKYKLSRFD